MRRVETEEALPPWFVWALVVVCVLVVGFVGIAFFDAKPLPDAGNVHLGQDAPWAISLAADAKHHWPIQDPNVAGLAMPYHWFVHVHLASASQVTGLDLPVIFLRLYTLPLIVLTVLQLVVAGKSLARSAYAGLVAACLVLLVNQLNLNHAGPFAHVAFQGVLTTYLHLSPSVPFGLVLLVPLLILIGEAISSPREATRVGDWVLITLFMIGASDAKVVILPMIVASLFLYGAARLLARRRLPPAVWIAGGLATAVFAGLYLLQYRGHSGGVKLDPAARVTLFNGMDAVGKVTPYLRDVLPTFPGSGTLLSSGGVVFGAIGLFSAQLIGLVWLLAQQRLRVTKRQAWLLAFLVTGIVVPLVRPRRAPGTSSTSSPTARSRGASCQRKACGSRGGADPASTRAGEQEPAARPRRTRDPCRRHDRAGAVVLEADADELALTYLWAYAGLVGGLLPISSGSEAGCLATAAGLPPGSPRRSSSSPERSTGRSSPRTACDPRARGGRRR